MTPIIDAYRAMLLRGELPAAVPFMLAAARSRSPFLPSSWVLFHRAEFQFAENV